VSDNGNPVQIKSASMVLIVAPNSLAITSSTLPSGTSGTTYSQTLQASGGTPGYTWSITSGSLPVGLSLAPTSGVISGTPAASGTANFTATVSDNGNPVQTKSVSMELVVAPNLLTITSSTLSSGSNGIAYSQVLQASGGTPGYSWSITSGSLPAGLTLAATTGAISGMPTVIGTSSFTATVSDNGNPVQTKSIAMTITVAAAQLPSGPGTTWYVRPDGGTRYSSNVAGQCDGKGDAPYSGSGVNQHCAFKDVRMLWSDGSYNYGTSFPGWGWVIAGGDTVIIRGSIGTGVSYRVGQNSPTSYCDSTGCWGIAGDQGASGPPPVPSGMSGQPTRILGENYASCSAQNSRTQLHGGWAVGSVFNVAGSAYVEVQCLDLTDFADCGHLAGAYGSQYVCALPAYDYANQGLLTDNTATNITLTNIRIHGLAQDGIHGATGGGWVVNGLEILGNSNAGWNNDDGSGTTGVGTLSVTNYNISWNGCVEEYPIVDPLPYHYCTDQSSGGYGDGFGTSTVTSPPPGWQVSFDQGIVAYNTQDGLDALHVAGAGSTLTVTRTLAYGNEGQQIKAGAGAQATLQNNVIVGNCEAMQSQTIPGTPAGFGAQLLSPCRAGNTAVLLYVNPGLPAKYQDNTLFSEGSIGVEVEYGGTDQGPTNTLLFNNNVFVGFLNAANGANATPVYSNSDLSMLANPGSSWTNNATYGARNNWTCPSAGETAAICTSPQLTDMTYHPFGYGNMSPLPGSSGVVGAGVSIQGITVDYIGDTRKSPPSIGAYESSH
jgi:hypothetical protein